MKGFDFATINKMTKKGICGKLFVCMKQRNNKHNSLPFRTTIYLALLNLRSMFLRTTMAILVSVFALTFIGFSLMMSEFDGNAKLREYANAETQPFVSFAPKTIIGEGVFATTDNAVIKDEVLAKFEDTGIPYATHQEFIEKIDMRYGTNATFAPNGAQSEFLQSKAGGMIEYDSLDDLGLKLLSGREPSNENEVLITSYHLEQYKKLGVALNNKTKDNIYYDTKNTIRLHFTDYLAYMKEGAKLTGWIKTDNTVRLEYNDVHPFFYDDDNDGIIEFDFEISDAMVIGGNSSALTYYQTSPFFDICYATPNVRGNPRDYDYDFTLTYGDTILHFSPHPETVENANDVIGVEIGTTYTIVGVVEMDLSEFDDIINLNPNDDNYTVAQTYKWADDARDGYLNCLFAKRGTFAIQNLATIKKFNNSKYFSTWAVQLENEERIWQAKEIQFDVSTLYPTTLGDIDYDKDFCLDMDLLPYILSDEELTILDDMAESEQIEWLRENIIGRNITIGCIINIPDTNTFYVVSYTTTVGTIFPATTPGVHLVLPNEFFEQNNFSMVDSILVSKANVDGVLELESFSIGEIYEDNEINYVFHLNADKSDEIYVISNYLGLVIRIFNALSFVFVFFAFLITLSLISNSIKARQGDIGVLRALGASKFSVSLVFVFECLFIALIEIGLSIITLLSCYKIMSNVLMDYIGRDPADYGIISMTIGRIGIIAGIAVLTLVSSLILPLVQINRKQPVEIIRRSER